MNDFNLINFKGRKLTIETYNILYEKSWEYLAGQIFNESNRKKIVITHHLPSPLCNIEKYMNSPINEGFCVDLTNKIIESKVDYWIYGHSHGNKKPFQIGSTMMMTNQLGYVFYEVNDQFVSDAMIELK
ncbi:MAG: hypothetical protein WAT71_05545 [Ignavibacteria bacterium]